MLFHLPLEQGILVALASQLSGPLGVFLLDVNGTHFFFPFIGFNFTTGPAPSANTNFALTKFKKPSQDRRRQRNRWCPSMSLPFTSDIRRQVAH
jgi:hypothetical protein